MTNRAKQNKTFKDDFANYSTWADASLDWTKQDQAAVTGNKYGLNNAAFNPVKSDATALATDNTYFITQQTTA